MSTRLDRKLEQIDSFTAGTDVHDLILKLVKALSEIPYKDTRFMSYVSLANIVGSEPKDPLVLQSVSILTSRSVNILAPMFVYFIDDEQEYVLKPSEFVQAKSDGYLVDPVSGEKNEKFLTSTYPYFSTTDEFGDIQGGR